MKKLIWILCLVLTVSLLSGCQTSYAGNSKQPIYEGVDREDEGNGIRLLPPENPGNSLIQYDPNRQIYIASENIYMDYYPGITSLPSFYFYIFSREALNTEEITVTFPVDMPFFLDVAQIQGIERKPQIIPVIDDDTLEANDFVMSFDDGVCLPFYVYQAYRNISFGTKEAESQLEKIYADFVSLTEADIPAFYVYSISVAFIDIQELEETVVLEKLDISIGGQTYEAKLGRVRLLPEENFPAEVPIAKAQGTMGSYYQLYNDGLVRIPGVLDWEDIPEDRTLTRLYMTEEESQVLDILVCTITDGQEMQMRWDGKTPIYLYEGDSVYIDVVLKNELTEKLLNYVMFHTVVEYQDGSGKTVCAVFTDIGSLISNFHEYYAIIFEGLDMEPYYRKSYYQLGALSWRSAYLK